MPCLLLESRGKACGAHVGRTTEAPNHKPRARVRGETPVMDPTIVCTRGGTYKARRHDTKRGAALPRERLRAPELRCAHPATFTAPRIRLDDEHREVVVAQACRRAGVQAQGGGKGGGAGKRQRLGVGGGGGKDLPNGSRSFIVLALVP